MDYSSQDSPTLRSASKVMLILACFVVVAFGMREAADIITPILLAFILSILFVPFQRWLLDRGVPSWLALIIVLLVILLVFSVLVSLMVVSITQLINRIPEYEASLQAMISDAEILMQALPFEVGDFLNLELIDASQILNFAGGLLGGVADAFSNWFVVVLLVAFMLIDFAVLPRKLNAMFKDGAQIKVISDLMSSIRRYVSITTLTGLLTGLANTLLLAFLGVDFAILWGIFGFLMNYIPNLGILLSIIPPAILALLEFGWQKALIVVIGFWLTNTIVENILKPRVIGQDLNISPLFTLISLVLWSFILGPVGTILAVPLTLIATKLLLENSYETRWLAVLMTAKPRAPDNEVVEKEDGSTIEEEAISEE